MSVGDVNSSARGSGARFNIGKPPLELIPLSVIADQWSLLPELEDLTAVMRGLGQFQAGEGAAALMRAIIALGEPWEDCARVFDYGRKKYSKRSDCICSAGDAVRLSLSGSVFIPTKEQTNENYSEDYANHATTKNSKHAIPDTESVKHPTTENGLKIRQTESEPGPQRGNVPPSENSIQDTERASASIDSRNHTDSRPSSTKNLSQQDVRSAAALIECTLTTVTQQAESGRRYAIPATSALDLSRGLEDGLRKHSPICGVHQTPGETGNWNWAKGMTWSVPLACAARHLMKMRKGEDLDPESGLPHRGHVLCNIVMLATFVSTYPEGDDRPKELRT